MGALTCGKGPLLSAHGGALEGRAAEDSKRGGKYNIFYILTHKICIILMYLLR